MTESVRERERQLEILWTLNFYLEQRNKDEIYTNYKGQKQQQLKQQQDFCVYKAPAILWEVVGTKTVMCNPYNLPQCSSVKDVIILVCRGQLSTIWTSENLNGFRTRIMILNVYKKSKQKNIQRAWIFAAPWMGFLSLRLCIYEFWCTIYGVKKVNFLCVSCESLSLVLRRWVGWGEERLKATTWRIVDAYLPTCQEKPYYWTVARKDRDGSLYYHPSVRWEPQARTTQAGQGLVHRLSQKNAQ